MRRIVGSMAVVFVLAVTAGPVAAGDYPPSTPAPPPASCSTSSVSASAPMLPGATVDLTVNADSIVAAAQYSGTLNSTPVALPATAAQANGAVTFGGVTLPSDWGLAATHSVRVVDVASGTSVCEVSFYVDAEGRVLAQAPTPPGPTTPTTQATGSGGLPITGSDSGTVAKVGAALVAFGAGAVLVARRRRGRPAHTAA